jgi:DNA-binding beta-propeller fold protein YncE
MAARRVSIYTATVALIVMAGCDGTAPVIPPATSSPASPSARANTIPITIGGGQALGLAVHKGAVWAISYDTATLSRIDPATNQVTLTASVGVPVATILSTGETLWAASYGGTPADSKIMRIDPATGKPTASIEPGEVCCDLSFGQGSLWAVDPRGELLRIDIATNKIVGRAKVDVDRNAHTNVVYAGDSAWVSSDTTKLLRLKGGKAPVTAYDVGGGVPFLAQEGKVWGASPTRIWAVDAATGRVTDSIDLPMSIEVISMAVTADAVWAGIRKPGRVGAVLELDRATGAVRRDLAEVDIPARMELTESDLWVTDSGGDKVHRISRE